jgi:hypothetical protein
MATPFRFHCSQCGQWHEGLPSPGWLYPIEYFDVPPEEREQRTELTSDTCIIDDKWFFIRACLEIPVQEGDEPLVYGVWVSVSEVSFELFERTYEQEGREREAPFFAWLTFVPPPFPQALLKTRVHLRPLPTRPTIELEPTEHPLAVAQRDGLSPAAVQKIIEHLLHGSQEGEETAL